MGIDPGSNTGVTIAYADINTHLCTILDSYTINIDSMMRNVPDTKLLTTSKRYLIDQYLSDNLITAMRRYDVEHVIYEAAYSRVSLLAYESLLYYGDVIRKSVNRYNWDVLSESVPPSVVKKNVGVSGNTGDKTLVKNAVLSHPCIIIPDNINTNTLTEHAIDSIAIAWYGAKSVFDTVNTCYRRK